MNTKETKSKKTKNTIVYENSILLTVNVSETPKEIDNPNFKIIGLNKEQEDKIIEQLKNSDQIRYASARGQWDGLNYVSLKVLDAKLKSKFLKLKERDIITVKGVVRNTYIPKKGTYFSIEILSFKKIGKKRK